MLNYCKGIKSTPKLKTKSNQLDCAIRNDFKIKLTVYEEFGSFLYGECKNEKKTPKNDYFYKLKDIIRTNKPDQERGVGIFFSRKPFPKRWGTTLQREAFKFDNIIIINFCDADFKLIKDGYNFLTLVQEKIQTIKANISTDPDKHNLYR